MHQDKEAHFEYLREIGANIIEVKDLDLLRENANLNGESFSGKMSKFGSEYSKWYAKTFVMPKHLVKAIADNKVYVHDLDQYVLGTTNCIFIPFGELLRTGFSTGNGSVRTANSITTAMALVAIIFQSQQNAQFGGVSANMIDWDLAPYVDKSFKKHFRKISHYIKSKWKDYEDPKLFRRLRRYLTNRLKYPDYSDIHIGNEELARNYPREYEYAYNETLNETCQAAESLIHNLNTMSSRAGGQIPFTSLNYGTCTTPEGRIVIDALLEATIKGLGHGETPVFPIQIFKCKKGINQDEGDPNYDLFVKAVECSARRLYPNFANIDAPFNLQYYREGDPDTEFATMGCRTRVIADRFGYNTLAGKGNLSFNTINLVRLGIEYGTCLGERSKADESGFYNELDRCLDIAIEGLIHRFELQARQQAKASDFMMREGVWKDGKTLKPSDHVRELIKHGSLSVGFIGLAECMKAMYGKHHAEDSSAYAKAFELVRYMRDYCDRKSNEYDLNISLFATPAEGLSGKFTKADREQYGELEGITNRAYYTNSFHVPVYHHILAHKKILIEQPFHELCNAGAISYVEIDGNARHNVAAIMKIVRFALDVGISYFSVNHTVDRCPVCGYEGIIGDSCPDCGVTEEEVHFYRLRRVTGYLTGDYQTRFNSAKVAEVTDRVKHK